MDERNYRVWIVPVKGKASKEWDWRVTVQRLTDGVTATQRVSGDWPVAEACAEALARRIDRSTDKGEENGK